MRYLSVFSGIEAATLAWRPIGWTSAGVSEIDPYACRVLEYRFPELTNYGDAKKFQEWEIPAGSIDVLVGGPPCQSWSGAGLRRGFKDERGRLVMVFLEMVEMFRPTWFAFENVPDIVSTDGGRALGHLLGQITDLGYGWAYRCLDASGWGVPQRRKRFFLIGHSSGDFRYSAHVLFESKRMHWDSEPMFKESVHPTGTTTDSPGTTVEKGFCWDGLNTSRALTRTISQFRLMPDKYNFNAVLQRTGNMDESPLVARHYTPLECERLMGFPDNFTNICWYKCCGVEYTGRLGDRSCSICNGLKQPKLVQMKDKRRYQLIGNSIVVPQLRWIGERIQLVSEKMN